MASAICGCIHSKLHSALNRTAKAKNGSQHKIRRRRFCFGRGVLNRATRFLSSRNVMPATPIPRTSMARRFWPRTSWAPFATVYVVTAVKRSAGTSRMSERSLNFMSASFVYEMPVIHALL